MKIPGSKLAAQSANPQQAAPELASASQRAEQLINAKTALAQKSGTALDKPINLDAFELPADKKELLKVAIRTKWSIGGASDAEDGIPRLTGEGFSPALQHLKPGDILLNGNGGGLSHAAVYIGDGEIIHAMATAQTMRGVGGSLLDLAEGKHFSDKGTGVIREKAADFFDRFERDTYVALRRDSLSEEATEAGIDKLKSLVGSPYDYDFTRGDGEFYCTELADVFLRSAQGDEAPRFDTKKEVIPGLLEADVIDPLAMLDHNGLRPVVANRAAEGQFAERLGDAPRID